MGTYDYPAGEKIAAQVSESRGRIATHEELHDTVNWP